MELNYDFPVVREKAFTQDGTYIDKEVIRRESDGHILSVVSETYKLLTHKAAVEQTEKVLAEVGEWKRGKTSLTQDGARMRMEYTFPKMNVNLGKTIDVHGKELDDIVNPTLVLQNSYDESLEFGFVLGAFRLVCTNGLRVGFDIMNISRRHTSGLDVDYILGQARTASDMFFNRVIPRYKELTTEKITNVKEFMENLKEEKKIPGRLVDKVSEGIIKNEITRWDAYNAFTRYLTHDYDKSEDRREELSQVVARAFNI